MWFQIESRELHTLEFRYVNLQKQFGLHEVLNCLTSLKLYSLLTVFTFPYLTTNGCFSLKVLNPALLD